MLDILFKPAAEELSIDEVLGDSKRLRLKEIVIEVAFEGLRPGHFRFVYHECVHFGQQVEHGVFVVEVYFKVNLTHYDGVSVEDLLWFQIYFLHRDWALVQCLSGIYSFLQLLAEANVCRTGIERVWNCKEWLLVRLIVPLGLH